MVRSSFLHPGDGPNLAWRLANGEWIVGEWIVKVMAAHRSLFATRHSPLAIRFSLFTREAGKTGDFHVVVNT
jgi:hypothetical protein